MMENPILAWYRRFLFVILFFLQVQQIWISWWSMGHIIGSDDYGSYDSNSQMLTRPWIYNFHHCRGNKHAPSIPRLHSVFSVERCCWCVCVDIVCASVALVHHLSVYISYPPTFTGNISFVIKAIRNLQKAAIFCRKFCIIPLKHLWMFASTVAEHKTSQPVKLLTCATCLREHPKIVQVET